MPACRYPLHLTKPTGEKYTVACGRCRACRINRTTEWTTRLLHEMRCHHDAVFVTLTYSDKFLPAQGSLSKRDLQLFFKLLRRQLGSDRPIRYFACGEYGERKGRPHYHCIIFGISRFEFKLIMDAWSRPILDRQGKKIRWKGEIISEYMCEWDKIELDKAIGTVTEQSTRYCSSYCQKQLFKKKEEYASVRKIREFTLCSRNPGIGSVFAQRFIKDWLSNGYIAVEGKKRPIPRYYFTKVSEHEAEQAKIRLADERFKDISRRLAGGTREERREILHPKENREARELFFEKRAELYNPKKF